MTGTVTPDGVLGFDGESYDPSAESGHFTCPRCGWATGWGGPADDDDFDDDPVRDHMDRHAEDDAKKSAAVRFKRGDRVQYTQEVQRAHGPAIGSRGTVTRVVDRSTDHADDPARIVVWVEMDADPTLVEAFYTRELVHVEPEPAHEPIPYKLVDEVPGVQRDPAFVPSTRAASSTPGLDGIRHGQIAPTPDEPAEAAWDRGETAGIVEGLRQAARVVEQRKTRIKDHDPAAGEALAALDDVVVELLDLAEKGGAA